MLLGQVELKLLFKARACIALTQGLERSPVCAELLRDALLGGDGGLGGLLILELEDAEEAS